MAEGLAEAVDMFRCMYLLVKQTTWQIGFHIRSEYPTYATKAQRGFYGLQNIYT